MLESLTQRAEISVCRLLMAVQSLLMAIRSLRMCIQRLQTEILPSIVKTFTKQLEGMMKGRGKGALGCCLLLSRLCSGLEPL